MGKQNYTEKTISVSKDGKKKQVIRITEIDGRKNRKGEIYKQTQTLHLSN
tara:strand:+ start:1146 stop:1295 length:150 start_codon:yes stop_codon:yes gene_type:complete